ncbi:hypothetical protein PCASD_13444 [Puccinia coronata f. sp. avenae]|uniref:Protein kinase domain-containing protein n=1 Tax=Puccinia coronata f. sp. avenae TaxID=200324 RepID=A0A2N5T672_9BASI|nr:hypothetical protein PCASD_13444 [Puccinia coronata f. sp. avenae]
MPPAYMLDMGRQTSQFFDVMEDTFNGSRKVYKLKSLEQYSKEHNIAEQPSKRYFQQNTLEDIISQYPKQNRIAFIDFVKGLLNLNPIERWSPQQARLHPFILGEPLREPYVPMKSGFADRSMDLGQKGYGSGPIGDPQSSPQTAGGSGSNDLSKRPYGGLPPAPVRSGQKVYDAATYSQLQAQQQVINAQAAAMRQHQAQAAQQSQNPYALPQDNRSTLTQMPPQSSHQQQHQPTNPASNLAQHSFFQPSTLLAAPRFLILPHSPPARPPPSTFLTRIIIILRVARQLLRPGTSGPRRALGNARGTLDQMDIVPPQLQKVQVDLANYSGQSVTPVLRRDDQYLAWEARQQQQHGLGPSNSSAIPGNSGLARRTSYRANPQLDYLHEQKAYF